MFFQLITTTDVPKKEREGPPPLPIRTWLRKIPQDTKLTPQLPPRPPKSKFNFGVLNQGEPPPLPVKDVELDTIGESK